MSEAPGDFRRMLTKYDRYVAGHLDSSHYCDVVADMYAKIYRVATDVRLKRLLLNRLWDMGGYHNRFHVGQVVADLIGKADSTAEAMMVADTIAANSSYAQFFWAYVKSGLAQPIDRTFKDALDR